MPFVSRISKLWSVVSNYVTATLAVAVVATSLGWYITDLKLDAEKSGRTADRANYSKALADFKATAIKNKMEVEKKHDQDAAKADADYSTLLGKYNTTLRLYASRSQGGSQQIRDLPSPSEAAQGSDGPGGNPSLLSGTTVTIPYEDAYICAVNTARLMVIQPWAKILEKENAAQAGSLEEGDQPEH